MAAEAPRGDLEACPSRLSSDATLEEYAIALVDALEQVARSGGRPAFDCLFDRGFDRLYAWSYRLAGRNPRRAQALTLEILLKAGRALARAAAEGGITAARDPSRQTGRPRPRDDLSRGRMSC